MDNVWAWCLSNIIFVQNDLSKVDQILRLMFSLMQLLRLMVRVLSLRSVHRFCKKFMSKYTYLWVPGSVLETIYLMNVAYFSKWRFPPLRKRCICFCVLFPFCKCDIRTANVLYKMCHQYPLCPYLQVSDLLPQEWKSSVSCSQPSFSWPVLPSLHKMNWQM